MRKIVRYEINVLTAYDTPSHSLNLPLNSGFMNAVILPEKDKIYLWFSLDVNEEKFEDCPVIIIGDSDTIPENSIYRTTLLGKYGEAFHIFTHKYTVIK